MDLLKQLSEMAAAPGREEHVRQFIGDRVAEHADAIDVDNLGNLICRKKPAGEPDDAQTVMVACHMDEIAFYVKYIHDEGFLRLQHLGGFDIRNLFARRVRIETREGEEIIGNLNPSGRPVHIASEEDKKKIPELKELFVDTGLPAEEVKAKIRPGDPVTLVQDFVEMGEHASGKSLDNRVACWTGIRLLERLESTEYDLHVVFTAQEEIGVRGATTSSYGVDPDIGIAIDTTLAVDIPDVPEEEHITELGEGTAIKIFDSYSVSHRELVDQFIALAEDRNIPHQFELLPAGGTDAGALQRARDGAKTITLSVPTRYIHTVTETIHQGDLHATVDLLEAFVEA